MGKNYVPKAREWVVILAWPEGRPCYYVVPIRAEDPGDMLAVAMARQRGGEIAGFVANVKRAQWLIDRHCVGRTLAPLQVLKVVVEQ